MRWVGVMVLLGGCATSRAEVHERAGRGDLEGVLAAWEEEPLRGAVLGGLPRFAAEPRARAIVEGALAAQSAEIRAKAVRVAPGMGTDLARILDAVDDPAPAVEEAARDVLSRSAGAAKPLLLDALCGHRRSTRVRLVAVQILGRDAPDAPVTACLLERAQRDDASSVREAACAALGASSVGAARDVLVALMREDPDTGVRMAAERAIARLGDQAEGALFIAVYPLENETGDDGPEMRRALAAIRRQIAARLSQERILRVVDEEQVDRAIAELVKMGSALYDEGTPGIEPGSFKIANQIVYGAVQRVGQRYAIVLQRLEVKTLTQVPGSGVVASGFKKDLSQLAVEAADQLIARVR